MKNEKNGEKGGRGMGGGEKISPQRLLRGKKRISEGRGRVGGEAGGANEYKCTVK